jgi:putative Holliday junction resolvase
MGLDYGSKTVGVAISDELGVTAQPIMTIERKSENKLRKTLAKIEELIDEYKVSFVVLGYPKNMNNTEGARVLATNEFKEHLERRTGLEVVLQDERMTTIEATNILKESGVRREDRKDYVDKMAAAIILQTYLDSHDITQG